MLAVCSSLYFSEDYAQEVYYSVENTSRNFSGGAFMNYWFLAN